VLYAEHGGPLLPACTVRGASCYAGCSTAGLQLSSSGQDGLRYCELSGFTRPRPAGRMSTQLCGGSLFAAVPGECCEGLSTFYRPTAPARGQDVSPPGTVWAEYGLVAGRFVM